MKRTKIALLILGLSVGLAAAPEAAFALSHAHRTATQKPAPSKKLLRPHSGGMQGDCKNGPGIMGGSGMMDGNGGGMMGGHGHWMMESPRMGMIRSLDLSDEQRWSINKLSDELQRRSWAAQGLIMDESAKLRDLYGADKRDAAAIGVEYQRIFDLKRQMIEDTINTQNRIDDLLTDEQRKQLKKSRVMAPTLGLGHLMY